MDDDAFLPGTPELQLHDEATVLMAGGALKNKRGVVHLTNDRLFFNDQRFNPSLAGGVGGVLARTMSEQLEKLRKEHPPMIDLALPDITASHTSRSSRSGTSWSSRRLPARADSPMSKTMSPLLRQALTERHGRKVVDDGADAWLVEV